MTTIALKRERDREAKARQRAKPGYKELEKSRRNRSKEWQATLRRRSTKEGWAKHILPQIRYRAAQRGLQFDLIWQDIEIPDVCPVLGIPLVLNYSPTSSTKCPPDRPSVDRLDNARGYTKDNIVVISNRANLLKKDASLEEIEKLYLFLRRETSSRQ